MTAQRCRECRWPMRPQNSEPQPGTRPAAARGLCGNCYVHHRGQGTLVDFERVTRPVVDTVEEWRFLHDAGLTDKQIADQLGILPQSLYRALWRARRKGLAA